MTILIYIYIAIIIFQLLAQPFLFGRERSPYSPNSWVVNVIANVPLIYILYTAI